jgi:hypothetical protein
MQFNWVTAWVFGDGLHAKSVTRITEESSATATGRHIQDVVALAMLALPATSSSLHRRHAVDHQGGGTAASVCMISVLAGERLNLQSHMYGMSLLLHDRLCSQPRKLLGAAASDCSYAGASSAELCMH